ncbi:MAG TPA: PD-(D/E)XK nuclease family protein [Ignavibacteriaceae bacterium]|nr:PD-(D/E)XK nuclease family protein [Ignavibacteriaceae bacterium]
MNKVGKIEFKKIKRVSPSQFYSMKNCVYKSVLAEAYEKKPLLPISINAFFGTVLHKILELITKKKIKNDDDFDRTFNEEVQSLEGNLIKDGYDFFVPLQINVKDFGLKKVLLKKHLFFPEQTKSYTNRNYHSEKWFESEDKLLAGKIDLIIEDENKTEIIDFKTGAITEDILDDNGEIFSEVKEEYKKQLKLYAYLYFENERKFPTYLSLIDLSKNKFSINFTKSECEKIFEEAKQLLILTNENIINRQFNANPSESNCKYCLYRPACSFYSKHLETNYNFNDVSGIVNKVIKYQNGNVSVFLQNNDNQFTVTRFSSDIFNELINSKEKKISIYNLRKEAVEFNYSATKTTIIYE